MEAITYTDEMMRQVSIPIARKTDGTGACLLQCKRGVAEYFRLTELPTPDDYGMLDPSGQFRLIHLVSRQGGANNMSLRIAYPGPPGSKRPLYSRFRLSADPILDTVQVLTDHLNEKRVNWLWICKSHGGRLSASCFRRTF